MLEFEESEMFRTGWWIEANPNNMIDVTEESWSWIWFGTRVGKIEVSVDLANADVFLIDKLVNEMDWYGDVLDAGGNCVGVENIDAGLAVNVDGHRTSGRGRKAEKRSNILCVDGALASCECAASLAVS